PGPGCSWLRSRPTRQGSVSSLRRKARPLRPALARARGWRPIRNTAASGRKETTAATARIQGPAVAGTVLTTSSLRNLLDLGMVLLEPGSRACRQPQNANEARCVLLIVACAHSERRKIGAVKRELRLAADHVYVALIQLERNFAGDFLLSFGDEGVQRFA